MDIAFFSTGSKIRLLLFAVLLFFSMLVVHSAYSLGELGETHDVENMLRAVMLNAKAIINPKRLLKRISARLYGIFSPIKRIFNLDLLLYCRLALLCTGFLKAVHLRLFVVLCLYFNAGRFKKHAKLA